jgi:hypothetical protein
MARFLGTELVGVISLCAALPMPAAAQGGWRHWDLFLRDGPRVEANPLGALDNAHIAISVGGMEGHDRVIARRRITLIAAQTTVGPRREGVAGDTLPPRPMGRACEDVIVLRDGRKTTGRVSLTRIRYSTGVVTQHDVEISLDSIAYIRFADPKPTGCRRKASG